MVQALKQNISNLIKKEREKKQKSNHESHRRACCGIVLCPSGRFERAKKALLVTNSIHFSCLTSFLQLYFSESMTIVQVRPFRPTVRNTIAAAHEYIIDAISSVFQCYSQLLCRTYVSSVSVMRANRCSQPRWIFYNRRRRNLSADAK